MQYDAKRKTIQCKIVYIRTQGRLQGFQEDLRDRQLRPGSLGFRVWGLGFRV